MGILSKKKNNEITHLHNDVGYKFSKKAQKNRWYVRGIILEAQKTLTPDNLGLLCAKITRRERERGIERANFLSNSLHDASIHHAKQCLRKRNNEDPSLFKSSITSK